MKTHWVQSKNRKKREDQKKKKRSSLHFRTDLVPGFDCRPKNKRRLNRDFERF